MMKYEGLKYCHALDVYEEYASTANDDLAKVYRKAEADEAIEELKSINASQANLLDSVCRELDEYKKREIELDLAQARIKELESIPHTDNSDVIARLLDERRWRKFSEEKPKEKQWILVFVENPSKYGTYTELRRWDMGLKFDVEVQELYTLWMPQPSAPKEDDIQTKRKMSK